MINEVVYVQPQEMSKVLNEYFLSVFTIMEARDFKEEN